MQSYENYLAAYPKGNYFAEANKEIEKIKEEEKRKAAALALAEENLWQEARQINTLQSYENYLAAYPQGKYATNAKPKIKVIEANIKVKPILIKVLAGLALAFFSWYGYATYNTNAKEKQRIADSLKLMENQKHIADSIETEQTKRKQIDKLFVLSDSLINNQKEAKDLIAADSILDKILELDSPLSYKLKLEQSKRLILDSAIIDAERQKKGYDIVKINKEQTTTEIFKKQVLTACSLIIKSKFSDASTKKKFKNIKSQLENR